MRYYLFWSFSAVASGVFCAFSATILHCLIHSRLSTGFPHILRSQFPSCPFSVVPSCSFSLVPSCSFSLVPSCSFSVVPSCSFSLVPSCSFSLVPSCSFSLVPSCSFSLASPFVLVGDFDSFLFFFPFYITVYTRVLYDI